MKRIKIKGMDIPLAGKALRERETSPFGGIYALEPRWFEGVKAKAVVKEGERVEAGAALFVWKGNEAVGFASPVSGTVKQIELGERRKLLSIRVEADAEQHYKDFGQCNPQQMTGEAVIEKIKEAGLFGYIRQLPFAIVARPDTMPRAIFISALRDMPLQGDFEYELEGQEDDFQLGLTALSRIAKTYLSIGASQTATALREAHDVEVVEIEGRCPAGNVGVQINHISPVNKGETVWTVDPTVVLFIGRLLHNGHIDLRRLVAMAGSEIDNPHYVETIVGEQIGKIIGTYDSPSTNDNNQAASPAQEAKIRIKSEGIRLICGNPLTGVQTTVEGFIGAHTSELTAIPEGADTYETLGWIMPRLKQYSAHRSYFSWFLGHRTYCPDARIKGGKRNMIMSGEYDRVFPMDIYAEYLLKAIIAGDIDKMEQLGIYEVSPEDFALAEFVDSSKQPLQEIVRQGIEKFRIENS